MLSKKNLEIGILVLLVIGIIIFLLLRKYKSKEGEEGKAIDMTLSYCVPPRVPLFDSCVLPAPVAPKVCGFGQVYDPNSGTCKIMTCPSGTYLVPNPLRCVPLR